MAKQSHLTFPVEKFARVFPAEGYALRYFAHQLNDLRHMIVVFAVSRSRSGIEEIVTACNEFEDLGCRINDRSLAGRKQLQPRIRLTTHATLHMSALGPHLAPSMTSGHRYCRVCMSSVKWCSTHVAAARESIDSHAVRKQVRTIPQICDLHRYSLVPFQNATV